MLLNNIAKAWELSSSQHVRGAKNNAELYLKSIGKKFPKQCDVPMPVDYRPQLDASSELSPKCAGHYQHLIGMLRCVVYLGLIDTCL